MKHLKKYFALLFLMVFWTTISTYGQNTFYKRQVVDSLTLKPLGYVNIVIKGKQAGTLTDETGYFSINGEKQDTLIISHIGYARKRVALSNNIKVIKLNPQSEILSEIEIKASKKLKREKLGCYNRKRKNVMSGVFQYALFIENQGENIGSINKLTFPIVHSWRRDKDDKREAQVRIRIYEKDPLTGAPGRDIFRKNYIINVNPKQKSIKLDLSEENIPFLHEGVFIGLDILGFIDTGSGELANYHINNVKKYLTIPLTNESDAPLTYINPDGSGWVLNKTFNPQSRQLEIANVCFGVEVIY